MKRLGSVVQDLESPSTKLGRERVEASVSEMENQLLRVFMQGLETKDMATMKVRSRWIKRSRYIGGGSLALSLT